MKQRRYEILDGLRGVAALMVVIFLLSEAFSYDPVYKHLNHGYLCVDFFFVLSGFVLGFAYERKMLSGVTSRWQFLKARLIRLQPMILLSLLFCLFVFSLGSKGLVLLVGLFALMLADGALSLNLFGLFPLTVVLGAKAVATGDRMKRAWDFLGRLS